MKFKDYLNEGLADSKNFTSNAQILRLAIQAEYDAVNLYEQLADKTTNASIRRVMKHVAHEEKEHIGEFEEMLEKFDDGHESSKEEGEEELEELGIK